MFRTISRALVGAFCIFALGACAPNYSPNTYSGNAVQLANRVEAGVIIGYRQVAISASGTIGTVTGGAAGGVLGAEYANSALVTVGATAVGSVIGSTLDHAIGDTTGWEYIVRKPSGEMLSVTQREKTPLSLAQKVLVIMGPQARVVPDYSVVPDAPAVQVVAPVVEKKPEAPVKVELVLSLPPGVAVQTTNLAANAIPSTEPQAEGTHAPPKRSDDLIPGLSDAMRTLGLSPIVATPAENARTATAETNLCAAEATETCSSAPVK